MRALLVGLGGIGANVYLPELLKLGYTVTTVDAVAVADFSNIDQITDAYDIAVICTPNFTHRYIAEVVASNGTKQIFIEKPGLLNSAEWISLTDRFSDTSFHLVKNNLYRSEYGDIEQHMLHQDVIAVDITWFSNNRIPSPGSWFTDKSKSFGGISRDLMPHLYCFATKLFGSKLINNAKFKQSCTQRWTLAAISSTDYGTVHPKGTYNVDDTATATATINGISVKLSASWKEGYDKQSITLFFRDGTTYEWQFGLCPAEAYGTMLSDTIDSTADDIAMHLFLEKFVGN